MSGHGNELSIRHDIDEKDFCESKFGFIFF
jgi:hypothetical protein